MMQFPAATESVFVFESGSHFIVFYNVWLQHLANY